MRHRVGHCAATGNETVRRLVRGNLFQDIAQNPALRRRQVPMGRREFPHATALLRHLETNVMGHRGRFRMERQPAQVRDGKIERLRQIRRRRQNRELELLEFFDVRAPIGQPA